MHVNRITAAFIAAILFLIALPLCFGQSESATISGRVTDSSGAIVRGVSVTLTSAERGTVQNSVTNDAGIYVFPVVHPGIYHIVISHQGFQQVSYPGLVANVQDHIEQNFTLKIGSVSESVTVSGEGLKLNTENAAVSTVVDSQFVENMPLNGRSFQSLIQLTPGAVVDASFAGPGMLSVNGQRTDANYFSVDGVSANVSSIGGSGNLPGFTVGGGTNGLVSVDAMQEFRIQTSTYAPEFGRTPGAQISIVTKSGSNQWHGTMFDYLRNDIFDARNYADVPPLPKPPTRQNDFGGTLSGPIWKDHTFFFFSYEGLRLRLPQTDSGQYFFSSDAKAAVNNSQNAGLWKDVVAATPTGTGPLLDPTCDNVSNPCLRELSTAFSNPSSFDAFSLRLDHNLTSKISLFARYNHAPSNENSSFYNFGSPSWIDSDIATLGLTATLSPTLVNDFRGNWSRQTGGNTNTVQSTLGASNSSAADLVPPGINLGNFDVTYYPSFDIPAGPNWGAYVIQKQRQLNFVDTLSKAVGSHQLKFGVDYRRMNPTQMSGSSLDVLAFSWSSVLDGSADWVINNTADTLTEHMNNWSLFGQDTWRLTPKFTLTYGVRWEINTPPDIDTTGKPVYSVNGVFNPGPLTLSAAGGTLWHTQLDAFAPRFGAAFQLTSKTVIRSGFGLFYDLGYGWGTNDLAGDFPYTRSAQFTSTIPLNFSYQDPATHLFPYQPLPFTTQIGPEAFTLDAIDPNLRLPVTEQWNFAIERELGSKQSITATYVGARGSKLLFQAYLTPPGIAQRIEAQDNAGISHYNSLQLQFMRRMSRGLQAMVSYSYAHSSDMNSGGSELGSYASIASVKIPPLTPSNFDIPQHFSAAVSYQVPKFSGGVMGAVTNGWSLDSIYRFQSGPPLDVYMNEFDPVLGYITVRPTRVPGQPAWIADPTQPSGEALNPSAFALQMNGASDDAQRNSLRSPYNISQVDLALRRRINLTDRVKLDLRVEYFNLFNRPMFGGYTSPYAYWGSCTSNTPASCTPSPDFGKLAYGVTTLNQATRAIPDGSVQGQDPLYSVGGPRSAQMTLRLSF